MKWVSSGLVDFLNSNGDTRIVGAWRNWMSGSKALFILVASFLGLGFLGCAEEVKPSPVAKSGLEITGLEVPEPVLEGSTLLIASRGLDPSSEGRRLRIEVLESGARVVLDEVDADARVGQAFLLDHDAFQGIGMGRHDVSLILIEGERESALFPSVLTLVSELSVNLNSGIDGTYFRNDGAIVIGSGFLAAEEGSVEAEIVGEFTPEQGAPTTVYTKLPVKLVEPLDRTRGTVTLTTAIGGFRPGTFEGTMTLSSDLVGGHTSRSGEQPVRIDFIPPALFDYGPTDPYLGQIITVRGGGFLGATDAATGDEATVLLFEGEITPAAGGAATPFGPKEAVAVFVSGQEVQLGLDVEVEGETLISSFFGVSRGTFSGQVTPIVIKGTDDQRGDAIPIEVKFSGVRQIVQVRFLPGMYDSLRYFGLSSAATQVTEAALQRMRDIYQDYSVEFVTEPPADFLPSAIATLEVGGPDPNGLGLFGYDNTPGKDIGNLRLFDSIGGTNAETQADNYPGYGGVFIESILYWSSHPELPSAIPGAGPEPDPLFDEIFDPVRSEPATLVEAESSSTEGRVGMVQRAIRALGSIIGETSAHELGHSLGLAQPLGPRDAYHSAFPGEGCLMDGGSFRELGERMGEPGYPETHFCNDEPEYLGDILPN